MHLRRALLLFALVLGLTALAASIAPAPRVDEEPRTTTPAPAPRASAETDEVQLRFRAPSVRETPPARKVDPGAKLVVSVAAKAPGQVTIPRLGRLESVTETAPARFDLLAPAPGRYDVLFEPLAGKAERIGSIVSAR